MNDAFILALTVNYIKERLWLQNNSKKMETIKTYTR